MAEEKKYIKHKGANYPDNFANKARTLIGMKPLPEAKVIDAGFVGNRIRKKTTDK